MLSLIVKVTHITANQFVTKNADGKTPDAESLKLIETSNNNTTVHGEKFDEENIHDLIGTMTEVEPGRQTHTQKSVKKVFQTAVKLVEEKCRARSRSNGWQLKLYAPHRTRQNMYGQVRDSRNLLKEPPFSALIHKIEHNNTT